MCFISHKQSSSRENRSSDGNWVGDEGSSSIGNLNWAKEHYYKGDNQRVVQAFDSNLPNLTYLGLVVQFSV